MGCFEWGLVWWMFADIQTHSKFFFNLAWILQGINDAEYIYLFYLIYSQVEPQGEGYVLESRTSFLALGELCWANLLSPQSFQDHPLSTSFNHVFTSPKAKSLLHWTSISAVTLIGIPDHSQNTENDGDCFISCLPHFAFLSEKQFPNS